MPAWFRFYNEAIDDRKLKHIARATRQPLISVIGAWSVLMALANNDHERGYLLLTADTPFKLEDLYNEIADGMDPDDVALMIAKFTQMGLVAYDDELDAYYLPAFSKRQYESDSSTERVRRYRERQAALQEENGNADVTLQERDCNAPETETETEADTESEGNKRGAKAPTPPAVAKYREATNLFPRKSLWQDIEQVIGTDPDDLDRWFKVCKAWVAVGWNPKNVKGMAQHYIEGRIPGDDQRARASPGQLSAADAVRQWVEEEGIEWRQTDA